MVGVFGVGQKAQRGAVTSERLHLPADTTCAAHARCIVRETLHSWGLDSFEPTASLLATEMATNAFLHAGGASMLMLSVDSTRLRIDVTDHVPESDPRRVDAGDLSENGRGLALVASIADRWGVRRSRREHTKTVWCELWLDGPRRRMGRLRR